MTTYDDQTLTIGPLLRQLREATGRTQQQLAADLSLRRSHPVEQGMISRWENEERLPDPVSRQLLADEFAVPLDQLCRAVVAARRLRRRHHHEDQEPDVDRRQFISASAGAGVAAIQLLPRLDAGRRLGAKTGHQLRQRTARLRRLDDFVGGGDTYTLYCAELTATTTLAAEGAYTEATGRELRAVIAEQAQLAGWAAFDAGRYNDARSHYMTALAASQAAEDKSLAGNSLAFLAYLEWATAGNSGIALATAACEAAGRGAVPTVRALLYDRLAWQHATSGNAREAERALEVAEEAIAEQPSDPAPDWVYWVDADEIAIMTGRCWAELHRPLRAIPALEAALGRYDDTRARDKALYLTWLASAYLDAGEIEHAAAITTRVLDLSAGLASVRPAGRSRMLLQRLQPHRALGPVGQLLDRAQV
ncbi:helix-turn-helix transcriptional regulator [Streptomyces sp. SID13588]|uniref:helix-turn-helix domain-containing protein n=1 Tax=Streptomyces sp. SID13588 TaxID=2706051 RepID=UPI0013CCD0FF|nr:helix-turn-helix transcriptional regulator [Streptomyces sp. SID13588]NEA73207.1 helix-turn-helix transcriptional regulator [Streptomyces sp. SID13588]